MIKKNHKKMEEITIFVIYLNVISFFLSFFYTLIAKCVS